MKSNNVSALDSQAYILSKVDSLKYFYEPKPNTIQIINLPWENTNGPRQPKYTINKDGLNQIRDFSKQKEKNVYRIVALGDSFTFGLNVNTEDNYPAQLQQIFNSKCKNKIQILNLGVPGYDIQYSVERFKLRGQKYDPDLILWLFIESDLFRVNELLRPSLKNEINYKTAYDKLIQDWGEDKILKKQDEQASEILKYSSSPILLLTFNNTQAKYKKAIENLLHLNNTLFYGNLPNVYGDSTESLPDGHPSPYGYKLISQEVFRQITDKKLIPCN
ncbi:MAG TPA: SGNH/GDSL hydrolase family protein [Patescibacteria group bacterium]|nr:SGNH/GDSL hydrolase family protein [Patescibacteria group bacterium]